MKVKTLTMILLSFITIFLVSSCSSTNENKPEQKQEDKQLNEKSEDSDEEIVV
jgi:hypothetical protein